MNYLKCLVLDKIDDTKVIGIAKSNHDVGFNSLNE